MEGNNLFLTSLVAGAMAGTAVDLLLFPLDTIKTRLQAQEGFMKCGGWQGMYKGVGSVVAGSAPGAALFFATYECGKKYLQPYTASDSVCHMVSASLGELAACTVRVPTEVIKQRTQASGHQSSLEALRYILSQSSGERVLAGLYRGYGSTIFREIPFTVIQFPLYEALKAWRARLTARKRVSAGEAAVCGCIAGGVAAGLTTPLDVIKTRLMLARERHSIGEITRQIVRDGGVQEFWLGVGPRVGWIGAGGAVFLGVYECARQYMDAWLE
ncbi:putative mitochondrial carrier protein PET8 [Neolecta irregularis DAH-3]|uniref:Putative mitochondrial carrier protein PET8 n=1 Tax=Neolecta irregularis (strain DAH-3) TaxID=1198029 RepID=A0A1U7LJ20_NEOID|nr:putative mitochondrial carrier protein PET8 [Neolecta irregularis DAH-3]|eukprot:OLL22521.1 putative mitochondrial carrier protein PET8 [Neolecta irregularis DAH-3]